MREYLQNAVGWAQVGLLDTVYPMAYRDTFAAYEANIAAYTDAQPRARVAPGLGAYKFSAPDVFARQLDHAIRTTSGFAIFSYDSLRPTAGDRRATNTNTWREKQRDRALRRAVVERFTGVAE